MYDLLLPSIKDSQPIINQKLAYQLLALNTKGKEVINVIDILKNNLFPNYKTDNEKCDSIKETLLKVMNNKLIFISRGDESGTHKKEKDLWKLTGFEIDEFTSWYKKIGQGMGSTLILANEIKD